MIKPRFRLSPQARSALVLFAGWVVGMALVLGIAFALGPFSTSASVVWTGVALAALVHATLAALLVRWGFELALWGVVTAWRRAQAVVALALSAAATVGAVHLDRRILAELTGAQHGAYRAAVVVGLLAGALFEGTYLVRWVRRVDAGGSAEPGRWDALVPLTGGVGVGVLAAALFIAGGAVVRNERLDRFEAEIPVIDGVDGVYFAFGDSYSAGEGLPPFDRWTEKVSADGSNRCHRSSRGYPRLLRFTEPAPAQVFTACSGAVISDIYTGHDQPGADATTFVAPQADGRVHPEAGLVTLTIGGNDLLFSKMVTFCIIHSHCMQDTFGRGITGGGRFVDYPEPQPLEDWITETLGRVSAEHRTLFSRLRRDYPNARILVIGYPYLFPGGPAGWFPNDCVSVLRRVGEDERDAVREQTDRFNALIHQEAAGAGLEFLSPVALWDGHEPCGDAGQFTNSVKPIGGDGSFHPSRSGQQALAELVSCYLGAHPVAPSAGGQESGGHPGPAPGALDNRIRCP